MNRARHASVDIFATVLLLLLLLQGPSVIDVLALLFSASCSTRLVANSLPFPSWPILPIHVHGPCMSVVCLPSNSGQDTGLGSPSLDPSLEMNTMHSTAGTRGKGTRRSHVLDKISLERAQIGILQRDANSGAFSNAQTWPRRS